MDLTCITAIATVVVAIAAIGSAAAATVYAVLTHRLILEQRESRLDDKFPCIVVRSLYGQGATTTGKEWRLRLVNVGRGPAFIESFKTKGLGPNYYPDGDHTHDIDNVIGSDVGDLDLRVYFAHGTPEVLRLPNVEIVIRYRDIAGRLFESRHIAGRLQYERL